MTDPASRKGRVTTLYTSSYRRPGYPVIVAAPSGRIIYQAKQPARLLQEAGDMERQREKERRRCAKMHGK